MTFKRSPRRRLVDVSATDHAFDELVPQSLRHLSRAHWTPVAVALRAAALLSPSPRMNVLDVGAGIGKLCSIGALYGHATWCGIEQHAHLVEAANRLSRALGVSRRVKFVHGDALAVEWDEFDAIYLYNPFALEPFPTTPPRDLKHYRISVARTEGRLARLRDGVRVVTFNGFGGVMPSGFQLVYQERVPVFGTDLVLWVKRSRRRATTHRSIDS